MKILDNLKKSIEWTRLAITQPREQLTSMQQKTRSAVEILTYCAKHLKEDRAPVLAAALSFRTLFGLFPVLVVATVTARTILKEDFPAIVGKILEELGLSSIKVTGNTSVNTPTDLGSWLQNIVQDASQVNLTALGSIGFGVVAISAIWLLVAIETGFNTIYRAPTGRSWPKRVVIYWFLLTGGPLLLVGVPWLNTHFTDAVSYLPSWGWLATVIDIGGGIAMFWVFTLLAYLWVPNTSVQYRPAMIGALVAAILLETGKQMLGLYTSHALTLNQLYGSLGLIPLFMFWVYMMWMFVLFGLEVSTILQVLRGRSPEVLALGEGVPGVVDPAMALRVVEEAGVMFSKGAVVEADTIGKELGLPSSVTRAILDRLVDRGILLRLQEADQFSIAKPLDQIDANEVLSVGYNLADESTRSSPPPLLEGLRAAQADLLKGVTLDNPRIQSVKDGSSPA